MLYLRAARLLAFDLAAAQSEAPPPALARAIDRLVQAQVAAIFRQEPADTPASVAADLAAAVNTDPADAAADLPFEAPARPDLHLPSLAALPDLPPGESVQVLYSWDQPCERPPFAPAQADVALEFDTDDAATTEADRRLVADVAAGRANAHSLGVVTTPGCACGMFVSVSRKGLVTQEGGVRVVHGRLFCGRVAWVDELTAKVTAPPAYGANLIGQAIRHGDKGGTK